MKRDAIEPLSPEVTTSQVIQAELSSCERVIEDGLQKFIEVGNALCAIRDKRLYTAAGFSTFETYCVTRWDFGASRARQICAAAETVKNLVPAGSVTTGNAVILPSNERQVRPLMRLHPEEQREIWREATQKAPGGRVSASLVQALVEAHHAKQPPAPAAPDHLNTPAGSESLAISPPSELAAPKNGGSASDPSLVEEVDDVLERMQNLISLAADTNNTKVQVAISFMRDFRTQLNAP